MEENGIWMLFLSGLGALGTVVFGLLWRRGEQRSLALATQVDAEKSALSEMKADLAREKKAREKLTSELSGYRKKTDKDRKRKSKTPAAPLGTQSRIQDLEEGMRALTLERDGLLTDHTAALDQVRTLSDAAAQLRTENGALSERLATAGARVLAPTPAGEEEGALSSLQEEVAEVRERAAKLESELGLARETEAKMRKRMSNQEQLYASIRAELDVKKDRLRTQEEQIQRLSALEIVHGSQAPLTEETDQEA